MKNVALFLRAAACLAAAASSSAYAHQIWIEQGAKSAKLYFGEFNDNLREASPGLLDKLNQPVATLLTAKGDRALKVDKLADALVVDGRAGKDESIVIEVTKYPVFDRKGEGQIPARTAWTPAARYVSSFAELAPKLTFDIIPTGKPGEFKLIFKGQPLPKTKVGIIALSGWGKDAWTNEQGIVKFAMPWKGSYVVEARHTENVAGERNGEKYDVASYGTTLSFVQSRGLAALPAPPAPKPNN